MRRPFGRRLTIAFLLPRRQGDNDAIYTDSSATTADFTGEIFPGQAERTYAVPALRAGSHFSRCDVHPTQMTGKLVVK